MNKTILVVDDSASLRQIVKLSLVGAGYQVVEASDGREALSLLDGRTVHLTVCDVNMPVMNGIEFVKAANELTNYKSMPIMMLTSETEISQFDEARTIGIRSWMTKPFAPSQLVKVVDQICLDYADSNELNPLNGDEPYGSKLQVSPEFSKAFRTWLTAQAAMANKDSRSCEFNLRKSACVRFDNLAATIVILDEFMSMNDSTQRKLVNDRFSGS